MQIKFNDDGVPLYQQLARQLRHRILSGQLTAGDELPAIRTFAERLKVNPNTVVRAYRELELEELIEKRRTRGTFVRGISKPLSPRQQTSLVQADIDQLLQVARGLDISLESLIELIRKRDSKLGNGK